MVSLCGRREGQFRKVHGERRTKVVLDTDVAHDESWPTDTTSELLHSSTLDPLPHTLYSKKCKPFQCLVCIGDRFLPLSERFYPLANNYCLQRHFDRFHPFKAGKPCPFPYSECASISLETMKDFKNHAAQVHGIFMSKKV